MRYFFDIGEDRDDVGTDLLGESAIPSQALGLLLAVAAHRPEIVRDLRLTVRDEAQIPVYRAHLRLNGEWLKQAAP